MSALRPLCIVGICASIFVKAHFHVCSIGRSAEMDIKGMYIFLVILVTLDELHFHVCNMGTSAQLDGPILLPLFTPPYILRRRPNMSV